jgi:hypothetical protein
MSKAEKIQYFEYGIWLGTSVYVEIGVVCACIPNTPRAT